MARRKKRQPIKARPIKPIENKKYIERVRSLLVNKPRDLLLFDLAIQTGTPMQHLLRLKVKDLGDVKAGTETPLQDGNRKLRFIMLNETVYLTLQRFLKEMAPDENDYLFASRKGANPLDISSVSRMVKGWLKAANLKGVGGVLSLRKTWEHHYRNNSQGKQRLTKEKESTDFLKPIQVTTIQEKALEELEQAILSGRIAPGQRLIVEEIARKMGVSRIPIREAFCKLEARGFISREKKRGFIINELSKENLEELMEIRLLLETRAAREGAIRCTDDALQKLGATYDQFAFAEAQNDVDETLRLNKIFHHLIYSQSNKKMLQKLINTVWEMVSPYFHIAIRKVNSYDRVLDIDFHRNMLEGMKQKDPDEVCKWLTKDITYSIEIVIPLFYH